MKAVGVREFAAHLRGETTLAEALAAAQRETRRYAKRQLTWMRGQMADWPRLDRRSTPTSQWRQFLALNPALTPWQRHAKRLILDLSRNSRAHHSCTRKATARGLTIASAP